MHSLTVKTIIPILLLLIIAACQLDKPSNVQETQSIESEIPSADNLSSSTPTETDDEQRSYWQKPDLVLSKLGRLENKTIADIGAGMGYFSFELAKRKAKKVIAVDIDEEMLKALNFFKSLMEEKDADFGERFEVRLAQPDNPNLKTNEIDIALIVNTVAYIENRVDYLKNLRDNIVDGGQIIIVDFKTRKLPDLLNAPSYEDRIYLHTVEEQLEAAGYTNIISDDTTLEYQFIVIASK